MSDEKNETPRRQGNRLIRELWPFIRPYKWMLFGSLALLVLSVPITNFPPLIWAYVVDKLLVFETASKELGEPSEVTEYPEVIASAETVGKELAVLEPPIDKLAAALGVLIGVYLLSSILTAFQKMLMDRVSRSVSRDIRQKVFGYLSHQTLSYHHDHNPGDLVTRVVSDVDAMHSSVISALISLIESFLSFIWVAAVVIALQPIVGSACLIPLVGSFLFIRAFNSKLKTRYDDVRQSLGKIGEFVHDRLSGIHVVQSYALQEDEEKRFCRETDKHLNASLGASVMRNVFFPTITFFGSLSNVIMLGLGVWFIWEGHMTIGILVSYRAYWWRLQAPIRTLARTSDILQKARASGDRILNVLNEPVAIRDNDDAVPLERPYGAVEFRNVRFAYPDGTPVLHGINCRIDPGEFIAVAGRSGSGKSTMLNLLMRFYEPSEGEIMIDGRDYRNYQLRTLRKNMAFVTQDTYLFNETLTDNIRYAVPDRTEEEVIEAAKAANAHNFICRLPRGYETVVGPRGVKLSGGQRQRVSLARAFLTNPRFLLLDEPTSAVEPESEKQIHDAILRLAENRTTLITTHRVSILQSAPRILFVCEGQLLGDGTHDELLLTCEQYAQTYEDWEIEEEELAHTGDSSENGTAEKTRREGSSSKTPALV